MFVGQHFQHPCPRRISNESRDDRILEALTRFRHDVMKEILQIKAVLKESLIGRPESLSHVDPPKTSIFNGDEAGSKTDFQGIRSMVDRNIREQCLNYFLDEQSDPSKLESLEPVRGHSIDISTLTGSHCDGTNVPFVSTCPTDLETKQTDDFVEVTSQSDRAPIFSTSTIEDTETFDSDVIPETSPLHNIVVNNRRCTASISAQDNHIEPCAVVSTATKSDDPIDFVKEEICSNDICLFQLRSTPVLTPQPNQKISSDSTTTTNVGIDNVLTSVGVTFRSSLPKRPRKTITCKVCEKPFSPAHFKTHMRTHTGEKPYQCELCNQRFACLSNLNGHRRIHTGERPFKCSQCSKRFTRSFHLKRHFKIHARNTSC